MARRPKYRIWDKVESKWFTPTYEAYKGNLEDLLLSPTGEITMVTLNLRQENMLSHESIFPDRFEVVEFTGLKDRNGKEIYEGDIIKGETITWSDSGHYTGTRETLGVVKFEHARFFLEDKETGARPDLLMGSQYHEVIGNIYEEAN